MEAGKKSIERGRLPEKRGLENLTSILLQKGRWVRGFRHPTGTMIGYLSIIIPWVGTFSDIEDGQLADFVCIFVFLDP